METEALEEKKETLSFLLDENYCVLITKNFEELFLFWRFSKYKISSFERGEYSPDLTVKIIGENGKSIMELSSKWDRRGIYLKLPCEDISCLAEIYCKKDGKEEKICSSQYVKVPSFCEEPSLGSGEYRL